MYTALGVRSLDTSRNTDPESRSRSNSLTRGDDQTKAFIWTNIFSIMAVLINVFVKIIHGQGVSIGWISLNRNAILPLIALGMLQRNPFKEFPYKKKKPLFWRVITGQLNFAVMNAAVVFLPLSLFTIIQKTTPFWTAILGFFIMKEAMLPIEIGGMFVCFGAFLFITLYGP